MEMDPTEMCLGLNKLNLHRFRERFQEAVSLFELLERGGGPPSMGVLGGIYIHYRIIAARDGALNIYHFGCCIDAVRALLSQSKEAAAKIDAKEIREIYRQFNSDFPNIENVRHALAHAGELFREPKALRMHMRQDVSDPQALMFITERLFERTYSVGHLGTLFSVTMDAQSIAKLQKFIGLMDVAFARSGGQGGRQIES